MSSDGTISHDKPLRIYFMSEYPLAREPGELTSASAHQIRDAAGEMWERGHDVLVIAPGYTDRPERDHDLPYPVRTLLFRPKDFRDRWSTIGPRFGFDYPVLDKNPRLNSRYRLWKMNEHNVDMLLGGYLGMLRLTSLIFGEPDVVVTPHAVSPWNYVASNYPMIAMSSESDQLPLDAPSHIRDIVLRGGERLFGVVALSKFVKSRLLDERPGFEVPEERIHHISRGLNPALFHQMADTTKSELLVRFPEQLKGISSSSRWTILYDEYEHPDVIRNLMKASSYVEREYPDEDFVSIVVTEGDGHALCEEIDRLQLQRMRLITGVGIREKAWFVNAADATVMYVGQEAPSMSSNDSLSRDLMVLEMTALVIKDNGQPKWYFPGRIDTFSDPVIDEALRDFDRNAGDMGEDTQKRVRFAIEELRTPGQRDTRTVLTVRPEMQGVRAHARKSVRYKARQIAFKNIVDALMNGIPADLKPMMLEQPRRRIRKDDRPFAIRSGVARGLEPLLFRAAAAGMRKPAELNYGDHTHSLLRHTRLNGITFHPEVRDAWERLKEDVDYHRAIGPAFRAWQHEILGALYTTELIHVGETFQLEAIPDPRRNPNGIISEMARLAGHRTEELFEYLAVIAAVPAEDLIRVRNAQPTGPESPRGGSGGSGGSGGGSGSGCDECGVSNNVVRLDPTASLSRRGVAVRSNMIWTSWHPRSGVVSAARTVRRPSDQKPLPATLGRLLPFKKIS